MIWNSIIPPRHLVNFLWSNPGTAPLCFNTFVAVNWNIIQTGFFLHDFALTQLENLHHFLILQDNLQLNMIWHKEVLTFISATNNENILFLFSEQGTKLDALYKENVSLQREAAALRSQNAKLDASYHEKEKNLNCLRTRHAVLEQVGNIFCTKWKHETKLNVMLKC